MAHGVKKNLKFGIAIASLRQKNKPNLRNATCYESKDGTGDNILSVHWFSYDP